MECSIEFIARNIFSDREYDQKLKQEFIMTVNRINTTPITIMQLFRSSDYNILYNTLHDEILYLIRQKQYFNNNLKQNYKKFINKYFDDQIELYKIHINKLLKM